MKFEAGEVDNSLLHTLLLSTLGGVLIVTFVAAVCLTKKRQHPAGDITDFGEGIFWSGPARKLEKNEAAIVLEFDTSLTELAKSSADPNALAHTLGTEILHGLRQLPNLRSRLAKLLNDPTTTVFVDLSRGVALLRAQRFTARRGGADEHFAPLVATQLLTRVQKREIVVRNRFTVRDVRITLPPCRAPEIDKHEIFKLRTLEKVLQAIDSSLDALSRV